MVFSLVKYIGGWAARFLDVGFSLEIQFLGFSSMAHHDRDYFL